MRRSPLFVWEVHLKGRAAVAKSLVPYQMALVGWCRQHRLRRSNNAEQRMDYEGRGITRVAIARAQDRAPCLRRPLILDVEQLTPATHAANDAQLSPPHPDLVRNWEGEEVVREGIAERG